VNPWKNLVVQNFGGTSLATPERIKQVASRVVEEKRAGKDIIVVVSAMGDTTDRLFKLAKVVSSNPPKRELDMLLTAGERISMSLLSMAISEMGYEAISFTGSQSGIVTDTAHTRAKIVDVRAFRVKDELTKGKIVIVAGFQGVSPTKEVTTLGRGGSDTTCVALAAAFDAGRCEIFTDVGGVYTADPRLVPNARKLGAISYDEMLELAFCGAGVLHWRSVDIARRFGVDIHVRSSFSKECGTVVTAKEKIERTDIRGITQDLNVVRIAVADPSDPVAVTNRILTTLERFDIPAKLVVASRLEKKSTVSIVIPKDQIEEITARLAEEPDLNKVSLDDDVATISIVGNGLCARPGVARTVLESLARSGIKPLAISTSGISMTVLARRQNIVAAIRNLHSDLGLDATRNGTQ